MNYIIPQDRYDEAMEYVFALANAINVGWDGECDSASEWDHLFLLRLKKGLTDCPLNYNTFIQNKEVIATLKGYRLDIDKFYLTILFVYDIVMDFCVNIAYNDKSDYDILVEICDYLSNHPYAVLYLSDDKDLRKSKCYKTNSPLILGNLRRFINHELNKYLNAQYPKIQTIDIFRRNCTTTLPSSHQKVLMYKIFKKLFSILKLPKLKAAKGEIVSYNKTLLISRIICLCKLTDKQSEEQFMTDDSSLKGIIKQYGKFDFNKAEPRTYIYGIFPKERE